MGSGLEGYMDAAPLIERILEDEGLTSDLDEPAAQLLVIGRDAYSAERAAVTASALSRMKLDQAVADGLNVLVMPQSHRVVMGLANDAPFSRRAFVRAADHPLLAGLDNADLQNWRGASDMIKAYPKWDDTFQQPALLALEQQRHGFDILV